MRLRGEIRSFSTGHHNRVNEHSDPHTLSTLRVNSGRAKLKLSGSIGKSPTGRLLDMFNRVPKVDLKIIINKYLLHYSTAFQ
jgi:hypothetical protein